MMARIETEAARRAMRLKFYKDDVFVIAHKAIKDMPCSLGLEELFCSAERLAHHLLVNEITEEEFIDFEIDDFESGCDDRKVAFLVLGIAFVKLCALRKANPVARKVAKALVHRCQQYEGFTEWLGKLDKAEQKRVVDKGRIDLLNYELKSIEEENPFDEYAENRINEYVNATLDCDVDVIKNVIVSFTEYNEKYGHKYSRQLSVLVQGYTDKLNGKEARKIIIEKAEFHDTTFGSMYDIHDNKNVHAK